VPGRFKTPPHHSLLLTSTGDFYSGAFCPNSLLASFQWFRFLRMVHGSQTECVVLQACRHLDVIQFRGLFQDPKRPPVKGIGLRVLILGLVKLSQVVEAGAHVGVLRAKGLFPNRHCTLVKGLGFRVLALGVVKRSQVVEAGGHVGVLRVQGFFQDRQRPLVKGLKGLGLRVLALIQFTRANA
jgi:hypothetical protein